MIVKPSVQPTLQQGIQRWNTVYLVAAVDVKLNVGESREITTLRRAGHHHTTPVEDILAGANLPSIKTQSIQLSTISMEKSLRTTLTNPQHKTMTQRERLRTKKPSWREKAGDVWQKIIGDTKPTMTPQLKPPWTDTGTHTFELTRQKTGDTTSNHIDDGEGLG